MKDWTAGYVADIGYTFGYYEELNPLRVKLAFANAGLVCPEFATACELGFGQGLSTNMHAAASICTWHGTDFSPSQAGFAQELASVAGANAQLFDESFAEFVGRDLPSFDYIGLHGIWSWISDENREIIVEFIRTKLKVGGVLYISYNTMPGWSSFAPVRHLMVEHAKVIGSIGDGAINRVNNAVMFTEKLLSTNPVFARANLLIAERVDKLKNQNRHYVAHEYFNRDWHPMYFSSISNWLNKAKVTFACSANFLDFVDVINLTKEQQEFLDQIEDSTLRQSVRDFMVNQQFRKDYWVKGPRKATMLERNESLRSQYVILIKPREEVPLIINAALGDANLNEGIYKPILDQLADHKPRSIGQLEQAVIKYGVTFAQLTQAVMVLKGGGHISAAQNDNGDDLKKKRSDSINNYILLKARSNGDINYLTSPIIGGGVFVGRFQQLFVLALQQGKKRPEEWAAFVADILAAQGQKIVKEGKAVNTAEEQLAELTNQANEFALKQLPILKALQIA